MKKNKFMTAILSIDEWNMIREAMTRYEEYLSDLLALASSKSMKEYIRRKYNLCYHFNHEATAKIEELDLKDKKERRKNVRKSKQKENHDFSTTQNNRIDG